MKTHIRKILKHELYTVVFISIFLLASSCVSSLITSKNYEDNNRANKRLQSFYLRSITITAFNFFEDEEIGYIMNKKLDFALRNVEDLIFKEVEAKNGYSIEPELVIKTFEEKYRKRNYYLLNVRVLHEGGTVLQYAYEYNGTASIFDGRIQNALIGKFIHDIKKYIK